MSYERNWKKYRATFDEKAEKIISKLSLEEKISLMSGSLSLDDILNSIRKKSRTHYNEVPYVAGGVDNIPKLRFVDGTRGVVCGNGTYTCFPVAAMRGATFNTDLEEEVGCAIGEEVIMAGGNFFAGICMNVPYHPGWGRAQETYSEDTNHISLMGQAIIRGVQSTGVIACVKHFAFNSIENIRREVDVDCDDRAANEVYLKQFKEAVEIGVGGVMTAYNSFRGEKCGQNHYLISTLLRDTWGFDGITMCDFTWGITNTEKAIKAGQNVEMPNTKFYGVKLLDAVKKGKITEQEIERAAKNIVRTLIAHESILKEVKIADKNSLLEKHRKLARRVAEEGITLLKNNGILPINVKNKKSKIVVLGELADYPNIGDRGSSQVYPPYVITPLEGILNNCGAAEVIYYKGDSIAHCKRIVKNADVVIVFAGNNYKDEGERISADVDEIASEDISGDRTDSLKISPKDLSIIKGVAESRDDIVVVLEGGSTIIVDDFIDDVAALIFSYYPGMEGGNAIADVLYGKVNPSGKLPFVIPKSEHDLQDFDWNNKRQVYNYYHGYTLLDKKGIAPRFEYGFGLSYTTFSKKVLEDNIDEQKISVRVAVKNTGSVAGAEVVKLYLIPGVSEYPCKILLGFTKVYLLPNEEKEITLSGYYNTYKLEQKNVSFRID